MIQYDILWFLKVVDEHWRGVKHYEKAFSSSALHLQVQHYSDAHSKDHNLASHGRVCQRYFQSITLKHFVYLKSASLKSMMEGPIEWKDVPVPLHMDFATNKRV